MDIKTNETKTTEIEVKNEPQNDVKTDENKKPEDNSMMELLKSLQSEIKELKKAKEEPKKEEIKKDKDNKETINKNDIKEELKRELFFEDLDKDKLKFIEDIPGYESLSVAQLKAILKKYNPVVASDDVKKKVVGVDIKENNTKSGTKTADQIVEETYRILHPQRKQ